MELISERKNNLQNSNAVQKRLIRKNESGSVNIVILLFIIMFVLEMIVGVILMINKGV